MRKPRTNIYRSGAGVLCTPVASDDTIPDRPIGRHFKKPDPEDYLFPPLPREKHPGKHFKPVAHN